ncbi:MAG: YqgE/AlgH family protein [Methyloligellaceae bacterium]
MSQETTNESEDSQDGYLNGQLLIAMPSISDTRFDHAVIYICAHSTEGAMGIIVNQPADHISFPELVEQLEIEPDAEDLTTLASMPVHVGGPVETGRGFVLHSSDYFADNATLTINDSVYLTATIDILRAIVNGDGPKKSLLALGFAGWSPGQLEEEIQENGWLNCDADADIIFNCETSKKYKKALAKLGVDPSHLVGEAGHA